MLLARLLAAIGGIVLVWATLLSALRTLVLPRAAADRLTRGLFTMLRRVYALRLKRHADYAVRDRIMATFAPVGLLLLLPTWLFGVALGFTLLFVAAGVEPLYRAAVLSGSSLLTLGFERVEGTGIMTLVFAEATIGLLLVALLIAYLPTMYGAFARRERAVNLLTVRAGTPVSAVEMLVRLHRVSGFEQVGELFGDWEAWFAEIEESHTSLAALAFFRSPQADESWVTAAGTVLDAAALLLSTVDRPWEPRAALALRAGYVALHRIADLFDLPYDPNPAFPASPISVTRQEFMDARAALAEGGLPLVADPEQAWQDYAGWRVNYDESLLRVAALVMAPVAPWTSDRSAVARR